MQDMNRESVRRFKRQVIYTAKGAASQWTIRNVRGGWGSLKTICSFTFSVCNCFWMHSCQFFPVFEL